MRTKTTLVSHGYNKTTHNLRFVDLNQFEDFRQMPLGSKNSASSSKLSQLKKMLPGVRPDESSSSSAILKSMLLSDERILETGKVSAGIYWKSIAAFCASILFMMLMFLFNLPWQLLLLFGVSLSAKVVIMTTIAYLRKHYLLLAATDKRVIIRVGIFNLEVIQMRYTQIESSEVASTIPGRILGYSSVFISGTGGQTLIIPFIINAMEFRNTITETLFHRDDAELQTNA